MHRLSAARSHMFTGYEVENKNCVLTICGSVALPKSMLFSGFVAHQHVKSAVYNALFGVDHAMSSTNSKSKLRFHCTNRPLSPIVTQVLLRYFGIRCVWKIKTYGEWRNDDSSYKNAHERAQVQAGLLMRGAGSRLKDLANCWKRRIPSQRIAIFWTQYRTYIRTSLPTMAPWYVPCCHRSYPTITKRLPLCPVFLQHEFFLVSRPLRRISQQNRPTFVVAFFFPRPAQRLQSCQINYTSLAKL